MEQTTQDIVVVIAILMSIVFIMVSKGNVFFRFYVLGAEVYAVMVLLVAMAVIIY